MKRVVGLVDNYEEAQDIIRDFKNEGIDPQGVHVLKSEDEDREDRVGLWERIKSFFGADTSEQDVDYYAEGVSRKGVVVSAEVPDNLVDRAVRIMSDHGAVDIDKRASEWKESGWTGYRTGRQEERTIPVAEEEVKIGKREVSRGGVRVYTTVTETPIEEDVTLREERAKVERRRVDKPATEAAFKETSIEMEEKAEEAVVSKQARVKEEVIVGKQPTERTERVRETARRTNVEVERQGMGPHDDDFRRNFQSQYSKQGERYDTYSPAYQYGSTLSTMSTYKGKDWSEIEQNVHKDWESRHPGTWEKFKDSIRYGWDKAKSKV
jgi:uncharacterized protein (TIGR02271 family)